MDMYLESGIKEYWIVDPVNTTTSIYAYDEYDVKSYTVYFEGQKAVSVHFQGLAVEVTR